jgi:hypothetical protein
MGASREIGNIICDSSKKVKLSLCLINLFYLRINTPVINKPPQYEGLWGNVGMAPCFMEVSDQFQPTTTIERRLGDPQSRSELPRRK